MKKHITLSRRLLITTCIILTFFILLTLLLFSYKRDEKRFSHITNQYFLDGMRSSTLNMHYSIAYPENFGLSAYQVVLPLYHKEGQQQSLLANRETYSSLQKIKPNKLSKGDQYAYKLLLHSLENHIALGEFLYFEEPLSPASGMQTQLPILLAEYTFRRKRDITDYLQLLEQTKDYFQSLLVFEQEKAAAGLLMPASSLKKVQEQCHTILTKQALEEQSHFLQTTFQERIQTLFDQGAITQREATHFLSENNRLLKTVMLPAYEALADGLLLLEDSSIPLCGLAQKPGGAQYYEHLLIYETGSYRPLSEITELLSTQLSKDYQSIEALVKENPQCSQLLASEEYTIFPFQGAAIMVGDLQQRMRKDFPVPNRKNQGAINVEIKAVTPSLEPYSAPAFYLTTPMDDNSNNVIYINKKNTPNGLELYTTLAHEGFPGHLYQNVYSTDFLTANEENKVRSLLWYGGYMEGWALYVELYSFDYASALMVENNRPQDALCIQLEKHNRSLQLCLYTILDILIHHENASLAEVGEKLASFFFTVSNVVEAIYTYIIENPCNYPKYYLGYLEVLALKEQAKQLWGEDYSDYRFHSFYLEAGPSDFSSLQELLLHHRLQIASVPQ